MEMLSRLLPLAPKTVDFFAFYSAKQAELITGDVVAKKIR